MLILVKVSVIVPVYNVEEYLSECLDSLVNQTLEDIEIVCVNDGSTDGSLEILNEYETRYSNLKVISQENKGLSGARNSGLEHVCGDYVYFIDSDDILVEDALEKMYDVSKSKSLDLLLFKLINFDDETKEKTKSSYYEMKYLSEYVGDKVFSHKDIAECIFRLAVTIQGKLFKRQIIEGMKFEEGIIFEDNPFFIEALFKSERVYFLDEHLYLKRVRTGSITQSPNEKFFDYLKVANMLIDISKRYGVYDDYKKSLFRKIFSNIFFRFCEVSDEYRDEFFKRIKTDFLEKKAELDNDEVFQNGPERYRKIFYNALEMDTPLEYELSVNLFDCEEELRETIEIKNEIDSQKRRFLRSSRQLKEEVKELQRTNRELKKENRKLSKDIERVERKNENLNNLNQELLNSTSWKATEPLRKISGKIRR